MSVSSEARIPHRVMGNPDCNGFIRIIAKESNYETECMLYSNLLFVKSSSYKNNEPTSI